MYKLCVLIPADHLEAVKAAMFIAGAGRIDNYEHCCWQVLGQGQFKPLTGSHPYMGKQNQLEKVAEYKVELVCADDDIKAVIKAMKAAHPYEVPAYQAWQIADL